MTIARITGVVLCLGLAACGGSGGSRSSAESGNGSAGPERVAVVEGLAAPEGVRYDPELDVYFVSNFNGEPAGDANGFISRVGADGAMQVREFMTGSSQHPLHGPRGMFLVGDTLWAADAGGIHAFDRHSGRQMAFVDCSSFEPGFLNDIAVGPDGALYVTDTDRHRILRVAGAKVTVALDDTLLCGPNGIAWDEAHARFLVASWNRGPRVTAWSPGSRAILPVGEPGPGGFDGIERVGESWFVASQSDSSLHVLDSAGERAVIRLPAGPADFAVDPKRRRVAIPMMDLDRVEVWSLPKGISSRP